MRKPRTRYTVRWDTRRRAWVLRRGDRAIRTTETWKGFPGQKAALINFAAAVAGKGRLTQLVVFTKAGRIEFERTWPRSSDPRRSRG